MAPMRPDPSHRRRCLDAPAAGPAAGRGGRRRPIDLSVVVPARNEAEALPTLLDEIAAALPAAGRSTGRRGAPARRLRGGRSSTTPRPTRRRPCWPAGGDRPGAAADPDGEQRRPVGGDGRRLPGGPGRLRRDARRRPPERPGRPGPALGPAAGRRRGPRLAGEARGRLDKRQISRWANRVRNAVLGQAIRDTGCSVRIFPREMALRLPMFRGGHRFFGPLLIREGCRIARSRSATGRGRTAGRTTRCGTAR